MALQTPLTQPPRPPRLPTGRRRRHGWWPRRGRAASREWFCGPGRGGRMGAPALPAGHLRSAPAQQRAAAARAGQQHSHRLVCGFLVLVLYLALLSAHVQGCPQPGAPRGGLWGDTTPAHTDPPLPTGPRGRNAARPAPSTRAPKPQRRTAVPGAAAPPVLPAATSGCPGRRLGIPKRGQ